ncbi:MAG: hypothetical protein EOO46_14220 [Flavobacterium sp.]|nr:MAG: hypothetical protein EOO46_14220 [Flavobacterium sp.]
MKKLTLFAFIAFSAMLFSCSSSSDSSSSTDSQEYFTYTVGGVEKTITAWEAYRTEDSFEVMGTNPDGTSMYFDFDVHGNLVRASNTPANSSSDPWLNSFMYYSSHYFNFEIVGIDEGNKMIKVNYSGNLYEEEYDLSSNATAVSGTFNIHYTETPPNVAGMGFNAKIGSDNWYGVSSGESIYGFTDAHIWQYSGDENRFDLNLNENNIATGTFNFTPASTENRVGFAKFNTTTEDFTEYNTTGTLHITAIQDINFSSAKVITGTFTLTAVNGGNTIQVTNGSFKTVYTP